MHFGFWLLGCLKSLKTLKPFRSSFSRSSFSRSSFSRSSFSSHCRYEPYIGRRVRVSAILQAISLMEPSTQNAFTRSTRRIDRSGSNYKKFAHKPLWTRRDSKRLRGIVSLIETQIFRSELRNQDRSRIKNLSLSIELKSLDSHKSQCDTQ